MAELPSRAAVGASLIQLILAGEASTRDQESFLGSSDPQESLGMTNDEYRGFVSGVLSLQEIVDGRFDALRS